MNTEAMTAAAEKLIDKAATADNANDALNYSQAACNAASALASLIEHSKAIQKEQSRIGYGNGSESDSEPEAAK